MKTYLIVDGNKAIKEYEKAFKQNTKQYKEMFRGWGYTYKAVKPKNAQKPYYYWYKWEYNPETKNNVWTYIGKDKPIDDIPDPPMSELENVQYTIMGENVVISETEFNKVSHLFEGYQKFEIQPA